MRVALLNLVIDVGDISYTKLACSLQQPTFVAFHVQLGTKRSLAASGDLIKLTHFTGVRKQKCFQDHTVAIYLPCITFTSASNVRLGLCLHELQKKLYSLTVETWTSCTRSAQLRALLWNVHCTMDWSI